MQLKNYQVRTLEILKKFLSAATDLPAAFKKFQDEKAFVYNPEYQPLRDLPEVPYICLRLPTGGGKTLMGAHAIQIAAENFLEREYPFVLWLVPFKEIRQQTLKALRDVDKFYSQFLYREFGQVNIFDVSEFRRLRPQDLSQKLNICVATFQSFKVTDREGRKVYQSDEELSACFSKIPRADFFTVDEKGRYHSFANLVSYLRPLMIIDEAHNYSTDLSFDVTKTLRPSAVIELTATPATNSNVLVRVTAQELNEEDMLKLPVIVGEVSDSPEKTITYAVQKRAALESLAAAENDYIRPITLYQAENKNRDFNVDFVKNYLIEGEKIPAEQIAIATGERHELDSVNLFSTDCKIRHIITVQALKEGWDCSFASVFCSLTNTHSERDAEQLLGRVLRMPNATRRNSAELNQAYAFFRVGSWLEAFGKIKDDLLAMGFDENEVKFALNPTQKLFEQNITFTVETAAPPVIDSLNMILQTQITTEKVDGGYKVTFENISEEDAKELLDNKTKIFKNVDDRNKFLKALNKPEISKRKSPAESGVKFEIPQLCLDFGDGAEVADADDFFIDEDWTITETGDYNLPLLRDDSDIKFFEFTLNGNKLKSRMFSDDEQNLFGGKTEWTQADLIFWLEDKISNDFITSKDFAEYTRRAFNILMNEKNFTLAELVRLRFKLKKLLEEKIESLIDAAQHQNFQATLFNDSPKIHVGKDITFSFKQDYYPAKKFYTGSVTFNKHFYPQVGDMNKEEIFCAQCIDTNKNVETWIRNIESDEKHSFWLPKHNGKFYPDFVVKLKNGIYAVIEYKGAMLVENSDTQEKNSVGEIWARSSNGVCKFLLATANDTRGRKIEMQIKDFLTN